MNQPELKLRKLLKNLPKEKTFETVMSELEKDTLSHEEKSAFAQFLVNLGYRRAVVLRCLSWLKGKKELPWGAFLGTLQVLKGHTSPQFAKALWQGAEEQGQLHVFLPCHTWDQQEPRFNKARKTWLRSKQTDNDKKYDEVREKFEFYKKNDMYREQEDALDQLEELAANKQVVKQEKQSMKERWARDLIARVSKRAPEEIAMEASQPRINVDEKRLIKTWLKELSDRCETSPSLAYDCGLLFYFISSPRSGLQVLKWAPENQAVDWFRLELCLEARLFARTLEVVEVYKKAYPDDAETEAISAYARAQALWGLGHTTEAIQLLEELISVRPSYRSAESLLAEWKEMAS